MASVAAATRPDVILRDMVVLRCGNCSAVGRPARRKVQTIFSHPSRGGDNGRKPPGPQRQFEDERRSALARHRSGDTGDVYRLQARSVKSAFGACALIPSPKDGARCAFRSATPSYSLTRNYLIILHDLCLPASATWGGPRPIVASVQATTSGTPTAPCRLAAAGIQRQPLKINDNMLR
jgi:hypothetical protein